MNFQMCKLDLEKPEEPEIKLPTSVGSLKKQENSRKMIFCKKITADGDCRHEIKRCLLLGRKAMTNLDSILESRYITLPTNVRLVKAMVFPVVTCGCESWITKKDEC